MKIKDLDFKQHPNWSDSTVAKAQFDNGYQASIITGSNAYTSEDNPYEIAVLDKDGNLAYDTPVTDDVIGHLDEAAANKVLSDIAALPAA